MSKLSFIIGSVVVLGGYPLAESSASASPYNTVWLLADDKHKEGEKHDHHDDNHHKGEKKELGEKAIGAFTVHVIQQGDVKAGEEAVFVLVLSGSSEKPKAVRGWVGVESGEKSIKSKAEDEGKEFHLHHPVSKPLPEKSKLWIEIETSSGKTKASFDTK